MIKDVTYAVSSFVNAAFLNPSECSDICPKLELEFVTEASPPDSALKCYSSILMRLDDPSFLDEIKKVNKVTESIYLQPLEAQIK